MEHMRPLPLNARAESHSAARLPFAALPILILLATAACTLGCAGSTAGQRAQRRKPKGWAEGLNHRYSQPEMGKGGADATAAAPSPATAKSPSTTKSA